MPRTILDESPESLRHAAEVLSGGGIIVIPSRTNYALICDAVSSAAVERLFLAKRRTKFGPLTLAVPDIESTGKYVSFPADFGMAELRRIWPDEVSFIFQLAYDLPRALTMGAQTIAVMRQHECALNRLLDVFKRPVGLTSANLSGQGNIVVTREKAIEDLSDEVDLIIVNDRADEVVDTSAPGVNPSNTIVDFSFGTPYLVRAGAVPARTLTPWIPELVLDTEQYKRLLAERLRAVSQ